LEDSSLSRDRVEVWLDGLVRRNRFTIAVVFPIIGAVMLVASAFGLMPGPLSFNSVLILFGTLVMRLPLISGLLPVLDRRGAAGIVLVTLYAYGIEYVGTMTGFPYGEFSYGVSIGPMVGQVPVGLVIFFVPLLINSYLLYVLFTERRGFLMLTGVAGLLVVFDLILDPAAVALGFWSYAGDPVFYGVPLSNFAGWMMSATITTTILVLTLPREAVRERLRTKPYMLDDLVSFVLLWGSINMVFGNLVPVLLAAGVGLVLLRSGRFDTDLFA
jgi:putative membrane protein